MKLASFHHSGAYNFEMAPRFLENLLIPVVEFNFYNSCSFNYFCETNIASIQNKQYYHSYLNTRKGYNFFHIHTID